MSTKFTRLAALLLAALLWPVMARSQETVLMSTGPATYKVGDTPTMFYDDGGPDGNISEQFEGVVTFEPTHPGKKVRIVFEELKLFNTSTTGYNDILNIYNGREAKQEALLATLLKQTATLCSTAADGSLTVTLKSTTGYPKEGFRARVEEFEPVAMTATALTGSSPSSLKTAAGQPIETLNFNIAVSGTEPALTLSALSLSTSGSSASLAELSLTDAKGKLLGTTTAINNNQATLSLSTPVTLAQLGNDFIVKAKPDNEAINGQTLKLTLSGVTLSSGNLAPATPIEANVEIDNVCQLKSGVNEYVIHGEWTLTHEPSQVSSYLAYDGDGGDRTVVLTPGTEGMFIELDFEKFSINWPNYGYSPSFKVYNGKSATGTPIWDCTKAQASTGPGVPVRSSALDGSLTVVFNPNSNRGASTNGIKAAVREYTPTPMTLSEVEVTQAGTDPLKAADKNVPILRMKVTTAGDLSPLAFDELKVNLKDVAASVEKVTLYATGKSENFSTDTPIATVLVADDASQITLVPQAYRLPEKTSYYWVTFDMKEAIEAGHNMDASVASMKVAGKEVEGIITPDPEGSRPSVNVYLFKGDDTVSVAGSLIFYDNGGPEANYTKQPGTVTFTPQPGQIIKMEFKDFYVNINDKFTVYDGIGTEGRLRANLYSEKTGDNTPAPIFSASEDGALTVNFTGNRPYNRGWEIIVSSIEPEMLHITEAEFSPIENAVITRGAKNLLIGRVKFTWEGNRGPSPISEFCFSSEGSAAGLLSGLSMTASDGLDAYVTTPEIGRSTTGNISVTTSATEPGIAYYWVRADISAEAEAGAKLALALKQIKNGDDLLCENPTGSVAYSLTKGLAGTYTIGTSAEADYATIQAAADALKTGVEGEVTFLIEKGDYNEKITIGTIPGASEEHKVTFRSASGSRDDVNIHFENYVSDYGTPETGVLTCYGAEWLTLEGLTFTTGNAAFPALVRIEEGSRHFTLRNCRLHTAGVDFNSPTLLESKIVSGSDKIPGNNNDFLTVEGCLFEGGYIGVEAGGCGIVNPVRLPRSKGARITGNTFRGQGSKGVYINNESNFAIKANYFESDANAGTSYYAIDMYGDEGQLLIEGNTILHGYARSSSAGMYLRPLNLQKDAQITIVNNEIIMPDAQGNVSGITVWDSCNGIRLAYNSILISGTATGSSCINLRDLTTDGEIRNNLLMNKAGGYALRATKAEQLPTVMGPNLMYSSESSRLGYVGADIASIEAWKEATSDQGSFTAEPQFAAADLLQPSDFTGLDKATPLAYVTTDIAGNSRSETNPMIGAYETAATGAPALSECYPAISSVTHESAIITLASADNGTARLLVAEASAEAPNAETLKSEGTELALRRGRETSLKAEGLNPNTEYKAYILLTSLTGVESEVIASQPFATTYKPTEVSTFENVEMLGEEHPGDFTDGTALFSGFVINERQNLPVADSHRVAMMEDTEATVTLTNASNLILNGFWLTNSDALTLTALAEDGTATKVSKSIPAGGWRYINLRDMGELAGLRFYTEGLAAIDDFSGSPATLTLAITGGDTRVDSGSSFTLTGTAAGGVEPFTYAWSNPLHESIGEASSLTREAEVTSIYTLTVTDAWGTEAVASTRVDVTGDMVVATFDDLYLPTDSKWNGDTTDPDYSTGSFLSGSFEFSNYYMAEWQSWSWFGYTSLTGTHFSDYRDDMVCAAGGGHESTNYAVTFMGDYFGPCLMNFTNTTGTQKVPGVWLTNTQWVKESVLDGDGLSDAFSKGDYCSVKISGKKADDTFTDPIEIRLADYTSENEADWYLLDTWQWFSLAELGDVKALKWEFFSTKRNSGGITTPSYVCLDDMGDACPIEEQEPVSLCEDDRTLELAPYFDFTEGEGTITYTLLSGEATITGDKAVVTAAAGQGTTLTVKGTQRGRSRWISLPVDVTVSSVGSLDASEVTGYSIYNTQGILLHESEQLPALPAGIYIIVRHTKNGDLRTVERR